MAGGRAWPEGCAWLGGVHGRGMHGRGACPGDAWQEGMHGRGYACQGACVAGGMHDRGGMHGRGEDTAACGTHPTGMHPCCTKTVTISLR